MTSIGDVRLESAPRIADKGGIICWWFSVRRRLFMSSRMDTLVLHMLDAPPLNLGHINPHETQWLLDTLARNPTGGLSFRGFAFGVRKFKVRTRMGGGTLLAIQGRPVNEDESVMTYVPGQQHSGTCT